jgi:hypothetical protein
MLSDPVRKGQHSKSLGNSHVGWLVLVQRTWPAATTLRSVDHFRRIR